MLRIRPARLRAAVENVDIVARARASFESLEGRVLMCATLEELTSKGVPAELVADGHIQRADYETLSAELKAHIDPHWIQEDPNTNLYSEPGKAAVYKSLEDVRAELTNSSRALGTVYEAQPDFFPLMYTAATLDQTSQTGRNLLRFGTQVNNQGLGPGCFISRDPGAPMPTDAPIVDPISSWINPDGSQNVLQKVFSYNTDTQQFTPMYYRAAGRVMYHSGHGHLHYDGYAGYKLRYRLANGQPGDYVQRADGTGVVGAKVGFCLLTFSGTFTTEGGQSSSTLPGYNRDSTDSMGQAVPANCGYNQGVRVGHYDQYSSGLEGQWLDVTGVPNGQYFVEIEMDAGKLMNETNETNNAKTFAVTLNASSTGTPIAPDIFDQNGAHNDTVETATDMGELGIFTQTGMTINWGFDKDFYEFVSTSTGTGSISITSGGGNGGNVDLYLYNDQQQLLKQSTLTSGTDSVSWNFVKGQEYYIKVITYNSTLSGNYQVAWNIRPTVDYPATDQIATESVAVPNTGVFTFTRNGPTSSPTTVAMLIGGSAVRGVDYTLSSPDGTINGNNLTLGNLASTVHVIVTAIADGIPENPESVTLSLNDTTTYVSGGGTSTVFIHDRLLPRGPLQPVSITAGPFGKTPIVGDDDKLDDELLAF